MYIGGETRELADLKAVEEKEMAWSIPESRNPQPQKPGAPHLWTLEDYYATQEVFGVRHPPEMLFSKAFSKQFRLPKISRHTNTELKVEVVKMNTEMFDWAFTPANDYIVYEYLGRFYLHGLCILPIFSPDSLWLISVPPLGDELHSFIDSYLHRASIHRLFSILHWKHGDRIAFQSEMYLLGELKLDEGSVTGRKMNTMFSGEAYGWSQVNIPMSVHNVDHIFHVGDGIQVIVGNYKGQTGMVIGEEDGCLTVWTTLSEENMPISSDSDSRLRLTLLLH